MLVVVITGGLGLAWVWAMGVYHMNPITQRTGYQPVQPVPYSHVTHVNKLGIDCRYCHNGVEFGAHATIPPTQTCMNCHKAIKTESEKLLPVREAYASGQPIKWIRIHNLGDFAYQDHSAHVLRGVGCKTCHGRIDTMEVVYQAEPLHMGFCLYCHRIPDEELRPVEYMTSMDWVPTEDMEKLAARLKEEYNLDPSTNCSTCHR